MMSDRLPNRRRWMMLLFLVLTLGLFSVAIWQYHQMVVAIYDGASASFYQRLLRPFRTLPEGIEQKPVRIALFHRRQLLPGDPTDADTAEGHVRLWERHLTDQGFGVRRVRDLMSRDDLTSYNLLVLPFVTVISEAEVDVIKQFVRGGGGLVMDWAVGTRRPRDGSWQPSPLLRDIAGIELMPVSPTPASPDRVHVELDPRSPLTLGVEPGFTLSVMRFDQPLSASIREPRVTAAGVRNVERPGASGVDSLRSLHRNDNVMIAHGDYLAGRFVWLGYSVTSIAPEPEQQQAFVRLIRNAVVWATRQPVAYKANWPEAVSSAFTLAWSLAEADDYDERLPALASAYHMPLTSYLSPAFMDDAPERVRDLSRLGPIGLLITPESFPTGDRPPLRSVLRDWRQRLESVNHGHIQGALLQIPAADPAWLDRMAEAGFNYAASAKSVHRLPSVVRTHRRVPILFRAHELWMLPDIVVTGPASYRDGVPALRHGHGLETIFEQVHERGGLLHLTVPARRIGTELIDELSVMLERIQRHRVWVSDTENILAYYQRWGHLRVFTDYPTPSRYVVQVSNSGTRTARDLTVFVRLPELRESPLVVTPTTLGTPQVHPVSDDQVTWHFDIDRIPAGKTFIYHLYR